MDFITLVSPTRLYLAVCYDTAANILRQLSFTSYRLVLKQQTTNTLTHKHSYPRYMSKVITQNKRIGGRIVYVPAVNPLILRIRRINKTYTFRLRNK